LPGRNNTRRRQTSRLHSKPSSDRLEPPARLSVFTRGICVSVRFERPLYLFLRRLEVPPIDDRPLRSLCSVAQESIISVILGHQAASLLHLTGLGMEIVMAIACLNNRFPQGCAYVLPCPWPNLSEFVPFLLLSKAGSSVFFLTAATVQAWFPPESFLVSEFSRMFQPLG